MEIEERYQDGSYRSGIDYLWATSLLNREDIYGANFFIFEQVSLPFLKTDEYNGTDEGFRNLLEKATPEEIDEFAKEIKKCEEYIRYSAGLEFG